MPQPLCFVDATYYNSNEFPEIAAAFTDHPEVCTVSGRAFQFKVVGILCVGSQPLVVFPKNYGTPEENENLIDDAKTLARALLRYRSEVGHDENELQLLFGDSDLSSNRIASAMFLLEDYCQNGYLRRQTVISTTNASGRTDWAATINKTTPIINHGRPLYTTPVIKKRISDTHNIICLTHKYVIQDCFSGWGWFFGLEGNRAEKVSLPVSPVEAIRLLKSELRNTYLEREVLVIQNLIKYLSEKYGIEQSRKLDVLATPYFSFVWEAICGYLFNNQYPRLKVLMPQPVWESDIVRGNIAQRPDIFFVRRNALYILDAKYYNYNHNIPGWHDVVKQLFYRHSMMSVAETRQFYRLLPTAQLIQNAFLFPGNGEDLLYVGKVKVPQVEDLGEVWAFAINQKKALYAYAYRDDLHFAETVRCSLTQAYELM